MDDTCFKYCTIVCQLEVFELLLSWWIYICPKLQNFVCIFCLCGICLLRKLCAWKDFVPPFQVDPLYSHTVLFRSLCGPELAEFRTVVFPNLKIWANQKTPFHPSGNMAALAGRKSAILQNFPVLKMKNGLYYTFVLVIISSTIAEVERPRGVSISSEYRWINQTWIESGGA